MSSRSSAGLPTQPARFGASANGSGFSENAVQFIAFDPAGGDNERAWRIKDLRAFAPAGSSVVRGPFVFSFDTPGLTTGVDFYTPTVGDHLLDAIIIVDSAFDGTTPKADIGTFVGTNNGLFKVLVNQAMDMAAAASEVGTGILFDGNGTVPGTLVSGAGYNGARSGWGIFTAANPLKLVVSQSGAKGGAAIGGTVGSARVYIVTATPSPF